MHDVRTGVNLKSTAVVGRALEEAVERAKHLAGQQEGEFSTTEGNARLPMCEEMRRTSINRHDRGHLLCRA